MRDGPSVPQMLLWVRPSVSSQLLGMVPFCCLNPNTRNKVGLLLCALPKYFVVSFNPSSLTSSSHFAEHVYVKVFTNSPTLVCMDLTLSQDEVIDPRYSWTGPDGRNLEGEELSAAHTAFLLFSHCLSRCFHAQVWKWPLGGGAGNRGSWGRKPTHLSLRGEKLSTNGWVEAAAPKITFSFFLLMLLCTAGPKHRTALGFVPQILALKYVSFLSLKCLG